MAFQERSIRLRLIGYVAAFATILTSLAILAAAALLRVDRSVAAIDPSGADRLVRATVFSTIVICAAAIGLAAWLTVRVRKTVTEPLAPMTESLSRLAAGARDLQMPELGRDDEIGEMARAFERFRAKVDALEQAHEATQIAQEHAQRMAGHDALTGLPNRSVLTAELQSVIEVMRRESEVYLVMVIDLDGFKPVNDLHGHAAGDVVLCEVARRLREVVRKEDTVARLGGDEFAVLAQSETGVHAEGAVLLATRLLCALKKPIVVGTSQIEVGSSIGIALCPQDGIGAESLLRAADIAMYRAKHEGRGTYRFFDASMDAQLRAQAALEAELRFAIAHGEICPYYQPLMNMRDLSLYGFEILARWRHPRRGLIAPDAFIPLAEELGLTQDLSTVMLRQACRDARQWPDHIRLALNISPAQLKDVRLPGVLLQVPEVEGFPSQRLEIEITENALVGDINCAKAILEAFQHAGIKVALDDFGTGYSSLSNLRELHFDKVKIDRSFVQSMWKNDENEKIVDAILGLAKSLGMAAVAEGVEDPMVMEALVKKGCDYGQGFYFGRAMSAGDAQERFFKAQQKTQTNVVG